MPKSRKRKSVVQAQRRRTNAAQRAASQQPSEAFDFDFGVLAQNASAPPGWWRGLRQFDPPGAYYTDWVTPSEEARSAPDSEPLTEDEEAQQYLMDVALRYAETYGEGGVPMPAAAHLDALALETELVDALLGNLPDLSREEAIDQLHVLHATGLLLVNDDGSVWKSTPPGTPYSPPDGSWVLHDMVLMPPPLD